MTITTKYDAGATLYIIHQDQIKTARVGSVTATTDDDGTINIRYSFTGIADTAFAEALCFANTGDLVASFRLDEPVEG